MSIKTNHTELETAEELTPELTPFQQNIRDLNGLRKELNNICYEREEFIYVLAHDPKLAQAIQTLIERVTVMKDIINEARSAPY